MPRDIFETNEFVIDFSYNGEPLSGLVTPKVDNDEIYYFVRPTTLVQFVNHCKLIFTMIFVFSKRKIEREYYIVPFLKDEKFYPDSNYKTS